MYFRVSLKMKKSLLCHCFTWIVFIELNFTVAFLLLRKTWGDIFPGKVKGWRILKNGGILVMGRWFWNGKVDIPLRTMSFNDNIWGADLVDMQLISNYNKGIQLIFCVIDVFSGYKCVDTLKDILFLWITNSFGRILDGSKCKLNKIWKS